MAVYTPSGSVSFNVNVNSAFASGTSNPQVLTAYNVPVNAAPFVSSIYTGNTSGGTTSGNATINRCIMTSGTITTGASATIVASLSTTSATQDVGGNTSPWNHVRELIIFNDGTSTSGFVTSDASIVTWEPAGSTITTAWGATTTSGYQPYTVAAVLTTGPKVDIPAGSYHRVSKPFGTNGWTVNQTASYNIVLTSPGAGSGTITYRIIVMGD